MRHALKSQQRGFIGYRFGRRRDDSGQVSILVVLAVGLFLIMFVGFGVDMTNLFLHRQMAQNAADAACVAGVRDLLAELNTGPTIPLPKVCQDTGSNAYVCGNLPASPAYLPTSYPCTGKSSGAVNHTGTATAPCVYAALNGYSSPSAAIPAVGVESNYVQVGFPLSIPGAVAPDPTVGGNYPYFQADVYDGVKVYFSSWAGGASTQVVHALAKCGLQQLQGPVPMLILDPIDPHTYTLKGTPAVRIIGGPTQSIQVNSTDPVAAYFQDAAVSTDLTQGGPTDSGSTFGVTGGPVTAPTEFLTNPPGTWQPGTAPIPDPFAAVPPPPDPGAAGKVTNGVLYGVNGCPAATCTEFTAGDYFGGITCKNATCIFDPGVYYVGTGGLNLDSNSTVRPSTATGDGSMGTVFYMTCSTPGNCAKSGEGSVSVWANSGKDGNPCTPPTGGGGIDCFALSRGVCPGVGGGLPTGGSPPLPTYVSGNVLMGPCTVAKNTPPSYTAAYDVPPTTVGPIRGMVLWADRSAAGSDDFGGGGHLLMIGTLYVHDCPNSPSCVPPNGSAGDYHSLLTLGGNGGGNTDVFGFIVADQLYMHGTPAISMFLNPFLVLNTLKAELMQ